MKFCELEKYCTEWDEMESKGGGWRAHVHYINNYPLHYWLPDGAWMMVKKIICFVGPSCEICMAIRWFLIGLLLGSLI